MKESLYHKKDCKIRIPRTRKGHRKLTEMTFCQNNYKKVIGMQKAELRNVECFHRK